MKTLLVLAAALRRGRAGGERVVCALVASALLSACSTLSTWLPTIPTPFSWFHSGPTYGPLPDYQAKATPRLNWQVAVGGKVGGGFAPAVLPDVVYAAGDDGTLVSIDSATGATRWRSTAGMPLSAGVGADATLVVVGTLKGDVLAFDTSGKPLWQGKVSSEVSGPPKPTETMLLVWSIDGKIFGLAPKDGTQKWVYSRTIPPLTVRRFAGGIVTRGGLFTGTTGGKLLAIDAGTGNLAWEGNVTTPKGATELERIADVTSLPVIDEREICAAAYQGRLACFDPLRGTLIWSRDFGSLGGLAIDNRYLYITDDKNAIQALDKTTGASVWKQDKLSARAPSGPVVVGDYLAVVDGEGYLHLLDRNDGSLVGRLATDGKATLAQPTASGNSVVWQSAGGNVISAASQ
jgi:outer membrane protein assembly factor BamB